MRNLTHPGGPTQVATNNGVSGNARMLMFVLLYYRLEQGLKRSWTDPGFRGLITIMLMIMGIGTVFYHNIERWSWVDSLYFCVVTASTVGYGDLSPQTTLGKLFTMGYIICSVGVFLSIVGTIGINMVRANKERDAVTEKERPKNGG